MPRVLITGAAGFIGMHTAIRFLKEGWDVVGLDNLNDYYSVALKRNRLKEIALAASSFGCSFEMFEEDLNSDVWNRLESFLFDAIIHLAAQAGVRYSIENPEAYIHSNILGFQKVLDFVVSSKHTRFLYASSSSVYGKNSKVPFNEIESCVQPESYYAATKRTNELMAFSYAKTKELNSIGLRFFTVYGPFGRPDMAPFLFAKAAMNKTKISVYNHGQQSRDFTYIDDIVEAIYRLTITSSNPKGAEVINIGQGSPVHLLDFIDIVEQVSGEELKKQFLPAQNGDVDITYADTAKLEDRINFKPQVGLNEGISKFWEWLSKYSN